MDSEHLRLFGEFNGHNKTLEECELILQTIWNDKERLKELSLFAYPGCAWFDYRQLHPVHRTYLFANLYAEKVRKIIREHIDDTEAKVTNAGKVIDWQPIKAGDIFDQPRAIKGWERKMRGLIASRQNADTIGCPYEVYLDSILHYYYFGKGSYVYARSNVPYPAINLFHNEKVTLVAQEAWLEAIKIKTQHANHSRYLSDDKHPDIAAHKSWLLQQSCLRTFPELSLRSLEAKGLLSQEDIKQFKKD